MPVAAQCPNCGKNLSETSVVAGAPHCTACGAWIVGVNGTLGLTSAYGHCDSSLTRRRVEADLAVLREYQSRYTGMMEDCKEKLNRGVEHYAKLPQAPQPPELLELEDSFGSLKFFGMCLLLTPVVGVASIVVAIPLGVVLIIIDGTFNWPFHSNAEMDLFLQHCALVCTALPVLIGLINILRVIIANGSKPAENSRRRREFVRRQNEYEEAVARALRTAEPVKAAEDHRLRVQVRELEGEITAVSEKLAAVRRDLATL